MTANGWVYTLHLTNHGEPFLSVDGFVSRAYAEAAGRELVSRLLPSQRDALAVISWRIDRVRGDLPFTIAY